MDYIKLTNENCIHNGYQYKEGLNCLNGEFNNKKICDSGGLYFCHKKDIMEWTYYNSTQMHYIWDDIELFKLAVKKNGWALEFVKPELMTDEICKLAIQQNGGALQFVKEELMTYKICKLAVQQNGYALQFIKPEMKFIKYNV